jgi:hypothetical protein
MEFLQPRSGLLGVVSPVPGFALPRPGAVMTHENRNLNLVRGPSVWTTPRWSRRYTPSIERVVAGAGGLGLLALGMRRRSRASGAFVAAGLGLLVLGAMPDGLGRARRWFEQRRLRDQGADRVAEASDESFPASDSPAWTSTASSGISKRRESDL